MEPQTLTKRSAEVRYYDCDFSALPECDPSVNDEDLTAATVTQSDPEALEEFEDPEPLLLGAPTVSGKRAQVLVEGGTSGYTYVLTYIVTTTGGSTLVGVGRLEVVDLLA